MHLLRKSLRTMRETSHNSISRKETVRGKLATDIEKMLITLCKIKKYPDLIVANVSQHMVKYLEKDVVDINSIKN